MNKKERILKYGETAYAKMLMQRRERYKINCEMKKEFSQDWRLENPEMVRMHTRAQTIKGGKRYKQFMKYKQTGTPHKREKIRMRHGHRWRPYKLIIAPDSQIHHQWRPGTSEYDGVALVEKDQHMRGFIDVIQILEGNITLLTEEEIREQ